MSKRGPITPRPDPEEYRITEHFTWMEASCGGVPVPESLRGNVRALSAALERIRTELGGRPIQIVSWWRTEEANRAAGGAPRSQHLRGLAADIRVPPLDARTVYACIDSLQRAGEIPPGGLHAYTDRPAERQFVHVDIRGEIKRWR